MNNLYDNTDLPMKLNLRLNLRNYRQWEGELRNVLTSFKLDACLYVPVENKCAPGQDPEMHAKLVLDAIKVKNLILESIPNCWYNRFRRYEVTNLYQCLRAICRGGMGALGSGGVNDPNVREIVNSIPQIYYSWADSLRYETYRIHGKIMAKKLLPGQSVRHHVNELVDMINQMDVLGKPIDDDSARDIILFSLHAGFDIVRLSHNDEGSSANLINILLNHAEEYLIRRDCQCF